MEVSKVFIRIAVITPEPFSLRITAYADTYPGIQFSVFPYQNPMECDSLPAELDECDVWLFAGPLPSYFARKQARSKRIPSVYIPSDEYTLTLTLAHILLNRKEGLRELSIDIPKKEYIEQAVDELSLDASRWRVQDFSQIIDEEGTPFDPEALIRFHRENVESGKSKLALTSVDYVYDQLTRAGIPCISMLVPEKSIRETVARATSIGQMMISENAQIAVGLAAIDPREGTFQENGTDAGIMLQQMLLELGKETDASIQQLGLDQFILYGTRGSVEKMTGNFLHMPVFGNLEKLFGVTISMGFGFGMTAKEAESNARIGLFHARKQVGVSSAFLVTKDKEVIGPLNEDLKAFHLKSEDRTVLHVAEETGISVATLNKLVAFIRLRRDNRFTATDLAAYLQVSRRSAERILKKLADKEFVRAVGEEQPYQQGRPRALYRINF
ncbi:hypothetical protein T458_21725 [Brevibacillus panacihumi W25]|uniref:Transcriptional regulator n=1 Tax=Brevibacillus panacihumi W25 TaxID=1408254 RepID=V6MDG4_9BACL|nr:hypothetical protein T458_21725 [Brevibacillus panacihumi W25]